MKVEEEKEEVYTCDKCGKVITISYCCKCNDSSVKHCHDCMTKCEIRKDN
jgi:hypothetical protein